MSRNRPAVVCAADDKYAMCLAAMTASLIDNCRSDDGIELFVLDGGISSRSRDRLEQQWSERQVEVTWIVPDAEHVSELPVSLHVNMMTYYRMLLAEVLPAGLSKVIYLDSDIVLEHDISEIWNLQMGGNTCLAVQDVGSPYIDSELALESFSRCKFGIAAVRPVSNYCEFAMNPEAEYFNAGVLVIDLERWRKDSIQDQLFECLNSNEEHVLWWDQYALNVVLYGKWGSLNPRWNQLPHAFHYLNWQFSPFEENVFRDATENPAVIHFASPAKPWHYFYWYPRRENYNKYLGRTAWAGHKPRPTIGDAKRFRRYYLPFRKARSRQWVVRLTTRLGFQYR